MPVRLASALFLLVALLAGAGAADSATVALPVIDTEITGGPADGAAIEDPRPIFTFAATVNGQPFATASFRCSVDNSPAEPCASPFQTPELGEGTHTFAVFAEDPARFIADPEPARRAFSLLEEEEECEEVEDEEGFVEEVCEEEDENSPLPPEECVLRSARARLFSYAAQEKVRLVIRYTSYAPADVTVEYRLNGGRGPLKLGSVKQRFAKKGVFRAVQELTEAQMERVRAAKRFTVAMSIPGIPRYCNSYETRHLTIRRLVHHQVVWFQSDSIFGARK